MGSRSPSANPTRWVIGALALGLTTGVSGCLLGEDNNPPILSVDLLWDNAPATDHFSPGSCASAGVLSMNWQLKAGDAVVSSSDDPHNQDPDAGSGNVECQNGFDFVGVRHSGSYDLTVNGFDSHGQMLWTDVCTGLVLARFDVLYQCTVESTPPQTQP